MPEDARASAPVQAGTLRVREFEPRDAAVWDAYVAHCPDATFFHLIGWRDILGE